MKPQVLIKVLQVRQLLCSWCSPPQKSKQKKPKQKPMDMARSVVANRRRCLLSTLVLRWVSQVADYVLE